ncbi:hypothetical protein BZA70DRAFT_22403 [Myxozyma melibiosi]|uniref:Transmembrane protein n=1 Tax=Myxozyma melibiosi TaxID=54550 RepID=A0ABR1FD56_9ASCO
MPTVARLIDLKRDEFINSKPHQGLRLIMRARSFILFLYSPDPGHRSWLPAALQLCFGVSKFCSFCFVCFRARLSRSYRTTFIFNVFVFVISFRLDWSVLFCSVLYCSVPKFVTYLSDDGCSGGRLRIFSVTSSIGGWAPEFFKVVWQFAIF